MLQAVEIGEDNGLQKRRTGGLYHFYDDEVESDEPTSSVLCLHNSTWDSYPIDGLGRRKDDSQADVDKEWRRRA
jgi:hypothetical protein